MNINRYNYEEYFLLYVDNELSSSDRKAVEEFVEKNPDLGEEFVLLKQSLLKPDHSLVLEDKSSLFRNEKDKLVTPGNYESFFLLYVDEELNAEERRAVEAFAEKHPSLQEELAILMQTRIEAEASVVFPDKQLLYKLAGPEKVIVLRLWKIVAVAAMFLMMLGIFWITTRTSSGSGKGIAGDNKPVQKTSQPSSEIKTNLPAKKQTNAELIAGTEKQNKKGLKQESNRKENQSQRELPVKQEASPENLLVETASPTDAVILHPAIITKVETSDLVKAANNFGNKKLIIDEAYIEPQPNEYGKLTRANDEPDDAIAIGPIETRNKMRGFFRRVSRVIEKRTHLPASQNKSLLIGNIEIALK